MKALKLILIILFCQTVLFSSLYAGDIAEGSVPTEINYQGRLEKDNAPITGPIHITFRIYDAVTGGNLEWESSELVVNAVQGIFSASIAPSWSVFATTENRYLEVQIESDVLSPREPFQSAVFSLVSKRLEDGSNISISSMTTTGSVTVNNNITIGPALSANGIFFPDGSFMNSDSIGSANNLSALTDAIIISDSNNDGSGNIIFRTGSITESARITDAGNMGIGNTPAADRKLDIDGSLYIGNEGIYDRDDAEINIMENLGVEGGVITGVSSWVNSESISIGVIDNVIALTSDDSERMRVHTNGYVGIGLTAPTSMLHVDGDIVSNEGVRGGDVSIGDYTVDWTGLNNEIRAADASHLLLQESNPFNVGIGIASPSEKLHVHGSIKADNGIIASTAAFSGDVAILGVLNANNPLGSNVELSSTVIYGTLQVTGGIASDKGYPAYLTSTQAFTGGNTFLNEVIVSTDMTALGRVGVGVINYNFGTEKKYLQVGDNTLGLVDADALVYLVAGSNANSKIHFYRDATEVARLETQGANNLALYTGGVKKMLVDSSNFRIFNTEFFVSATEGSTPAIYVSPTDGNVGMGTEVLDPNWQLTVEGNIRISTAASPGDSHGIIFADGTILNTAGGGSANALSNNDDVLIRSDVDKDGGGDVIISAGSGNGMIINSGGNIGMGTQNPVSKLNILGGDLVLGEPYYPENPYKLNGVEDLIIEGSIVVDGSIIQRSDDPVYLSALIVSGEVLLSTASTSVYTGIGTVTPGYKLDVTGDINASGNIRTGTTIRLSNTGILSNTTWNGGTIAVGYGGTGATTFTADGILYGNTANAVNVTDAGSEYEVLRAGNGGTPAFGSINLDQSLAVTGTLPVGNGGTGVTTLTGVLHGNGSGAFTASDVSLSSSVIGTLPVGNGGTGVTSLTSGGILYGGGGGDIGALAVMADGQLLIGNGATAPTLATLGGSNISVTNGAGTITIGIPQSVATTATPTFGGLTLNGNADMNSTGKIINLVDPSLNQDAATKNYVDGATGGGKAWGLSGNNINDSNDFIGSTGSDAFIIKTNNAVRMTITAAGVIQLNNALDVSYGGTGSTSQAGARSNLGLSIGSNVQAYDADLTDLADGTLSGSKIGSGVPTANIAAGSLGSSVIASSIAVNAVQNASIVGVAGSKVSGDIAGNAATATTAGSATTVTNGVYTDGLYANPGWITELAGSKITGGYTGSVAATCSITVVNGLITGFVCP